MHSLSSIANRRYLLIRLVEKYPDLALSQFVPVILVGTHQLIPLVDAICDVIVVSVLIPKPG